MYKRQKHKRVPTTHTILLYQRLGRMASCGSPPPRAAATPGAAAIHAATTPSIEARKYNASTSSDILAAACYATAAAAVLIPGSISTHMKVNVAATFGQKMSPIWAYVAKLHRRFRARDEPGQKRHAACVAETARSVVCTPQRYRGFDPTFAQGIILCYTPEAICQNCVVRT